jgi:hypothetical protein
MRTNHRKGWMLASFAVALLATLTLVPPAHAGPISDMLAKRRQAKMNKLPPMTKPHTVVPIKDPYAQHASLSQRFKQRFGLKKDQGVVKTSR